LQADKKVSIGFLLPTIVVLKKQLERLQTNQRIKHCKPLINGLLSGVNKRFGDMFSDDELRLAAFLHPRFKLSWIADEKSIVTQFSETFTRPLMDIRNNSNTHGDYCNIIKITFQLLKTAIFLA
jgi:hypothetical protein